MFVRFDILMAFSRIQKKTDILYFFEKFMFYLRSNACSGIVCNVVLKRFPAFK